MYVAKNQNVLNTTMLNIRKTFAIALALLRNRCTC